MRAITLMQFTLALIRDNQAALAHQALVPVIDKDIQYIVANWKNPTCDLWEEVYGDQFYTRMVQRRALVDAAKLSSFLSLDKTSLMNEVADLSTQILNHWDPDRGYFVATLNRVSGIDDKVSNLDSSIILGILHGHTSDGFLSFSDPRVLSTAQKLSDTFKSLYPVNQENSGVAIGRYPEDVYNGTTNDGGNPWVLLTAAMARFYYRTAAETGNDFYATIGDEFLERVQYHAPADGVFSEQIDRNDGFMTSARDLTWSHSEVLEAFAARPAR